MEPQEAYEELIYRARERALLGSCSAILGWDEQTYLPVAGADHRGAQMALLAGLQHEKATDPRVGELLTIVEGSGLLLADTGGVSAVNVRELRRSHDRQVRLPRALVEELRAHHFTSPSAMGGGEVGQRFRRVSTLAGKDYLS